MGRTDKNSERPKQDNDKSKKPPSAPDDDYDYDYEDGDMATPKRDRSGDDDQPL